MPNIYNLIKPNHKQILQTATLIRCSIFEESFWQDFRLTERRISKFWIETTSFVAFNELEQIASVSRRKGCLRSFRLKRTRRTSRRRQAKIHGKEELGAFAFLSCESVGNPFLSSGPRFLQTFLSSR